MTLTEALAFVKTISRDIQCILSRERYAELNQALLIIEEALLGAIVHPPSGNKGVLTDIAADVPAQRCATFTDSDREPYPTDFQVRVRPGDPTPIPGAYRCPICGQLGFPSIKADGCTDCANTGRATPVQKAKPADPPLIPEAKTIPDGTAIWVESNRYPQWVDLIQQHAECLNAIRERVLDMLPKLNLLLQERELNIKLLNEDITGR